RPALDGGIARELGGGSEGGPASARAVLSLADAGAGGAAAAATARRPAGVGGALAWAVERAWQARDRGDGRDDGGRARLRLAGQHRGAFRGLASRARAGGRRAAGAGELASRFARQATSGAGAGPAGAARGVAAGGSGDG